MANVRTKTEHPLITENAVRITGTVIHLYRVPGVDTTILTIATSGSSTRTNYPKVVFYGRSDEIEADIFVGDRVEIEATVQTKKYQRDGEAAVYRQSIVGSEIEKAKDKIETTFNIATEQQGYVEDRNEVQLAGTAVHIYKVPDRDIVIMTIRTLSAGHVNFPQITLFGRNAQYVLDEIAEGSAVCCVGLVYTNRSERDGERKYYEGVTCTNISIAPFETEGDEQ